MEAPVKTHTAPHTLPLHQSFLLSFRHLIILSLSLHPSSLPLSSSMLCSYVEISRHSFSTKVKYWKCSIAWTVTSGEEEWSAKRFHSKLKHIYSSFTAPESKHLWNHLVHKYWQFLRRKFQHNHTRTLDTKIRKDLTNEVMISQIALQGFCSVYFNIQIWLLSLQLML